MFIWSNKGEVRKNTELFVAYYTKYISLVCHQVFAFMITLRHDMYHISAKSASGTIYVTCLHRE